MLASYKILVKGKVQGVWFRKYTLEKARSLHLKGYVMNRDDGSVFVRVEGDSDEIKVFIDWLHIGSPLSDVQEVESEAVALEQLSEFVIRY